MKYITLDEAILTHNEIIDTIGGLAGHTSEQIGLLASALEHIKNDEYYPELPDKLAHLMFACVKFHPFLDGNKRTAIFLAMHFLDLDDKYSEEFAQEFEDVVVDLAADKLSKQDLRALLEEFISAKRC